MGGGRKQYQVLVDPTALHEYGVTLQEVEDGAARPTTSTPPAGSPCAGESERPIRVIGRLGPEPEQVARRPAQGPGQDDAAADRPARSRSPASSRARRSSAATRASTAAPAWSLTVVKQPHADTRELTDSVIAALARGRAGAAGRRGGRHRPVPAQAASSTAASTTSARRWSSGPCWCWSSCSCSCSTSAPRSSR